MTKVVFSIARQAAWAPGVTSPAQWAQWARAPRRLAGIDEPAVAAMPAMLRRRAGSLARMALEVAYACLGNGADVPTVFCSRHGEVARSFDLLDDLAHGEPLSPTAFALSVHNAGAGLFSIARADRANHVALAAGVDTLEHGVIEACALLADGAPMVLLVAYDAPLPAALAGFEDCAEQPFAFAWAMVPVGDRPLSLSWRAATDDDDADANVAEAADAADAAAAHGVVPGIDAMPGALQVLRFRIAGGAPLVRRNGRRLWTWSHDA